MDTIPVCSSLSAYWWYECRSKESWCYQANECTAVQIGTWKLPRHGEPPKCYSSWLAQFSEPLNELLRNNTLWYWEAKHQKAFEVIKDELTKTSVVAYFDPKADHIIQVDGSMKDLCTGYLKRQTCHICIQNIETSWDRIIQYWEFFCVVFGLERQHHYVLQQDQGTNWPQATNTHIEVNCSI